MEYLLKRSRRRTLSLEIKNGKLLVRAPYRVPVSEIETFIRAHRHWILQHLEKAAAQEERLAEEGVLTPEELEALVKRAKEWIPGRVSHYADLLGVSYSRITVRKQRTRWGSCSRKGNLNFNCLLMLMPEKAADAVVAHEVCHLREMNHSPAFYRLVRSICPDYDHWNRWIKENGPSLLRRLGKAE